MSAQALSLMTLNLTATAAVVKYRAVTMGGANGAADLLGVSLTDANTGQMFPVVTHGTAIIEAAGAIAAGTKYLTAAADGRAQAGGVVAACLGKLKPGQSASAAGDLVEIVLTPTV